MAIKIIGGTSGVEADTDENKNLLVVLGSPAYSVGGEYTVSGWTTAAVAAALAANTSLVSMRFAPASARKAYVTKIRVAFTVITPGANGGVPGVIGIQRFMTATPTGGTARTVAKKSSVFPNNSDMTDVRDSNAALTVASVIFGDIVGASLVPTWPELTSGAINGAFEWVWEPGDSPVVLAGGDGLCLRTQVAMPATTTWGFSYTAHWYEK